jgi:hypothetical protein
MIKIKPMIRFFNALTPYIFRGAAKQLASRSGPGCIAQGRY